MLQAHKQALQRDLEDEKQRLLLLREARNSANQESLALRRDRKHQIAELRFLRHMAEEEEGLILVLQNSNQYLEASRGNLESNSMTLAKDLQRQISIEKEQLQQEAKQCAELRAQLQELQSAERSSVPLSGLGGDRGPKTTLTPGNLGPLAHREGV
eukprot:Skav227076  [mRNA]  locus=scaffold4434:27261:27862:+ [translate_table: standard]